jgi:hypothetical protein
MDNSLLIKYLLVWVFAFASVVGENSNNGGRAWNTNNGTMATSLGLSLNPTIARNQYDSLVDTTDIKLFGFVITN